MELPEYFAILRQRWPSLVITATVVLLLVGVLTVAATPQYEATTKLFFAVPGGESISDLAQGSSFTEKQMSSYARVAASPLVLSRVSEQLDIGKSEDEIAAKIRTNIPAGTVILEITARSEDPEEAASIANEVGAQLAEVASTLYPERADGGEVVRATSLSKAVAPGTPSSPRPIRNFAIAGLLGLSMGIAAAISRDRFDSKVRSPRDVERVTDRAILGSVSFDPDTEQSPIVIVDRPGSPRAEEIRRLRTNLQFVEHGLGARSILVTSSVASEGKTTTAANLAVALSDAGSSVLIVDADLRRPSLHRILGLEGGSGLTSVLIGRASADEVIQPWQDGRIHVLAAGAIPPNPSELLGSAAMEAVLSELKSKYDAIVIDSPPLLPVTDAAVLSRRVDGTLVVVSADRTNRAQLGAALETLEAIGAPILGLVLNKVDSRHGSQYGGYSYSYVQHDAV